MINEVKLHDGTRRTGIQVWSGATGGDDRDGRNRPLPWLGLLIGDGEEHWAACKGTGRTRLDGCGESFIAGDAEPGLSAGDSAYGWLLQICARIAGLVLSGWRSCVLPRGYGGIRNHIRPLKSIIRPLANF